MPVCQTVSDRIGLTGYDSQKPVHGDPVSGVDVVQYPVRDRDAGQAVFPGDDGAVDQHAPPFLHHGGCQGNYKGNVEVDPLADQDLAFSEVNQIPGVTDQSGRSFGNPLTGGMTHNLAGPKPEVGNGILITCRGVLRSAGCGKGAGGQGRYFCHALQISLIGFRFCKDGFNRCVSKLTGQPGNPGTENNHSGIH